MLYAEEGSGKEHKSKKGRCAYDFFPLHRGSSCSTSSTCKNRHTSVQRKKNVYAHSCCRVCLCPHRVDAPEKAILKGAPSKGAVGAGIPTATTAAAATSASTDTSAGAGMLPKQHSLLKPAGGVAGSAPAAAVAAAATGVTNALQGGPLTLQQRYMQVCGRGAGM